MQTNLPGSPLAANAPASAGLRMPAVPTAHPLDRPADTVGFQTVLDRLTAKSGWDVNHHAAPATADPDAAADDATADTGAEAEIRDPDVQTDPAIEPAPHLPPQISGVAPGGAEKAADAAGPGENDAVGARPRPLLSSNDSPRLPGALNTQVAAISPPQSRQSEFAPLPTAQQATTPAGQTGLLQTPPLDQRPTAAAPGAAQPAPDATTYRPQTAAALSGNSALRDPSAAIATANRMSGALSADSTTGALSAYATTALPPETAKPLKSDVADPTGGQNLSRTAEWSPEPPGGASGTTQPPSRTSAEVGHMVQGAETARILSSPAGILLAQPDGPDAGLAFETRTMAETPGAMRGMPAMPPASTPETARQISVQISEAAHKRGTGHVDLTLNPAELGRVRLSLLPGDNTIMVSITADRPETLDLMRRHIDLLAQDFREMGYQNPKFSFDSDTRKDPPLPAEQQQTASPQPEPESPVQIRTRHGSVADRVDIRL